MEELGEEVLGVAINGTQVFLLAEEHTGISVPAQILLVGRLLSQFIGSVLPAWEVRCLRAFVDVKKNRPMSTGSKHGEHIIKRGDNELAHGQGCSKDFKCFCGRPQPAAFALISSRVAPSSKCASRWATRKIQRWTPSPGGWAAIE